jgi:hypothetical protein
MCQSPLAMMALKTLSQAARPLKVPFQIARKASHGIMRAGFWGGVDCARFTQLFFYL